ncbi:AAA family ATPase [Lysinibacillus sp. KU-BSD001]|uniref:McrB family protein n=1 Tax=Lysinibacillus sp. KU-BSD001 TaxID=3141328 RepID=UPI0036E2B53B
MQQQGAYYIENEGDAMAYSSEKGNVNVDVLHNELKLNRKGAEVVFQNDDLFVISPSIQNGANWFDIRKLNLDRFKMSNKKGLLILRHEQHFLFADLHDFALQLMKETYLRSSKTGGEHWKFNIENLDAQYFVYNQGNRNLLYTMRYSDKQTLKNDIEKMSKKITPYQLNNQEEFNNEVNEEGMNLVFTNLDDKEVLEHTHSYLTSRGFLYSKENIANLYLSLRSKPFVIISGISGTGKTKIVQLFAESVGATEANRQFKLISVRPDWSDSSDLLGYKNLQDQFVEGQLTEMVKRAHANPQLPYFVLLDEMNLARVEYYLSEFLSIMESRRVGEDGEVVSSILVTTNDGAFSLPNNLYIIGTVNMDETTHSFSKKVLDRANTIEFNDIQLNHFAMFEQDEEEVAAVRVGNEQFESKYLYLKQAYAENKELVQQVSVQLEKMNEQLQMIYAQVGYRVRDEICFYMLYNDEMQLLSEEEAFDCCVMQKILPRISGADSTVDDLLKNLYKQFTGKAYEKDKVVSEDAPYPRSAKKVVEMLNRLYKDGFTSFWVS